MPKGNPNPSPGTRFGAGNNANPQGVTAEARRKHIESAEIVADLRLKLLTEYSKLPAAELMAKLDANLNAAFKQAEDRAYGTPPATTTHQGDPDHPLNAVIVVEMIK